MVSHNDIDTAIAQIERKHFKELHEKKLLFDANIKAIKKSYNNTDCYVIPFIFITSLLSIIIYKNFDHESYFKSHYPDIYDTVANIKFDIDLYNTFELALIITGYHYFMYTVIANRFLVIFACVIFGIYTSIQYIN